MPIRGPNSTYTYTVYESAKRAHRDLYDSRNVTGLQCYHTMPLYERLCDKVDSEFQDAFRVVLGFNQKRISSRREQIRLLRSSLYQSRGKKNMLNSLLPKGLSRLRYFEIAAADQVPVEKLVRVKRQPVIH